MATLTFDHTYPKIIEVTFSTSMQKISSFHLFIPEIQPILESHDIGWPHLFLTTLTQKNFDELLIYVDLYQHAKNQATS